jgi:hypothetical protein
MFSQIESRKRPPAIRSLLSVLVSLAVPETKNSWRASAFQPYFPLPSTSTALADASRRTPLFSSVGDGDEPPREPKDNDGDLDGFLNGDKNESDNLKKAREFMSETSLPISFNQKNETKGDEASPDKKDGIDNIPLDPESSALVNAFGSASSSSLFAGEATTAKQLAKNPYMQVVSKLSPSELISKFTATANPRVQEAVRSTILGLIGSLPKMAFDTTTITTGQRLASLMFQLQMTGYMFKNAEYRLSLSQSLGMSSGELSSSLLLKGAAEEEEEQDLQDAILSGKIRGKLRVHLGGSNETAKPKPSSSTSGPEIEVDAAAYMSELRTEVSRLKEELNEHKEANEEALRKDLLLYIRTLPGQELKSLTNTMSPDVLVCMKGLVQAVLSGIGDGKIAPDTVTEQSGEAMAQLCMWQLAVGYNLRELEVREELKKNISTMLDDDDKNGVDLDQPGTLE